ncbi:unnamed protein product [Miscanthus lutarioriparius]|uniref:Leucine-rich repeat-containing N-terminal plant-type domain-containing protein n=1 Tax=Miscanthus lutarioriparius TaxID=422564 RepID=A0A811S072_9POAL|nr:unnamed protein product [Miscanthus lutarioriparius]
MGGRGAPEATRRVVAVVGVVVAAAAVLCPTAAGKLGKQAKVLVAIKAALHDPGNVLWDWHLKFGNDPCHWRMVTCQKGQILELLLSHNALSGPIPDTVGRMKLLEVLDLSNNYFSGTIPSTLGHLAKLHNLKLNNNSLSGPISESLATDAPMIFSLYFLLTTFFLSLLHCSLNEYVQFSLDVSFNSLSGHRPTFRTWNVLGFSSHE